MMAMPTVDCFVSRAQTETQLKSSSEFMGFERKWDLREIHL